MVGTTWEATLATKEALASAGVAGVGLALSSDSTLEANLAWAGDSDPLVVVATGSTTEGISLAITGAPTPASVA